MVGFTPNSPDGKSSSKIHSNVVQLPFLRPTWAKVQTFFNSFNGTPESLRDVITRTAYATGLLKDKSQFSNLPELFKIVENSSDFGKGLVDEFFSVTVHEMIQLILNSESYFTEPLRLLRRGVRGSVSLNEEQVLIILSFAFFCLLPSPSSDKMTCLSFRKFYKNVNQSQAAKLSGMLCYFNSAFGHDRYIQSCLTKNEESENIKSEIVNLTNQIKEANDTRTKIKELKEYVASNPKAKDVKEVEKEIDHLTQSSTNLVDDDLIQKNERLNEIKTKNVTLVPVPPRLCELKVSVQRRVISDSKTYLPPPAFWETCQRKMSSLHTQTVNNVHNVYFNEAVVNGLLEGKMRTADDAFYKNNNRCALTNDGNINQTSSRHQQLSALEPLLYTQKMANDALGTGMSVEDRDCIQYPALLAVLVLCERASIPEEVITVSGVPLTSREERYATSPVMRKVSLYAGVGIESIRSHVGTPISEDELMASLSRFFYTCQSKIGTVSSKDINLVVAMEASNANVEHTKKLRKEQRNLIADLEESNEIIGASNGLLSGVVGSWSPDTFFDSHHQTEFVHANLLPSSDAQWLTQGHLMMRLMVGWIAASASGRQFLISYHNTDDLDDAKQFLWNQRVAQLKEICLSCSQKKITVGMMVSLLLSAMENLREKNIELTDSILSALKMGL